MSNWEDTVIKPDELGLAIIKHPELPMGQAIAIEQAEISFKIGKTAGVAESLIPSVNAIKDSYKAGINEVVKWIEEHKYKTRYLEGDIMVSVEDWQTQLKDWFKDNPELLKEWGL